MPYLFSLGFAVCLFSTWIWLHERKLWLRLTIFPLLATLNFYSHLMGFVTYALLVSLYEFGRYIEVVWHRAPKKLLLFDSVQRSNVVLIGLQFFIPLVIFAVLGPSSETTEAFAKTSHGGIVRKLGLLLDSFSYLMPPYLWKMDSILVIVIPVSFLLLAAFRKLGIACEMKLPLLGLLVFFFAMPVEWLGGWGGDHRLLPAIGAVLFGSLYLRDLKSNFIVATAICIIATFVIMRVAAVTVEWRRADAEYAEFFEAFELLDKGSKLFYAVSFEGPKIIGKRPKISISLLAVTKKQVYVPYLFTGAIVRGIPLRYRSDYERLLSLAPAPYLPYGKSPNWEVLISQYDYLLLVNEHFFSIAVPQDLTPLYKGSDFVLYKISK